MAIRRTAALVRERRTLIIDLVRGSGTLGCALESLTDGHPERLGDALNRFPDLGETHLVDFQGLADGVGDIRTLERPALGEAVGLEQMHFPLGAGRSPQHFLRLKLLHDENEVRRLDEVWREGAGAMSEAVHPDVLEDPLRLPRRTHPIYREDAGGFDPDRLKPRALEELLHEALGHHAAAAVAGADKQDPFRVDLRGARPGLPPTA